MEKEEKPLEISVAELPIIVREGGQIRLIRKYLELNWKFLAAWIILSGLAICFGFYSLGFWGGLLNLAAGMILNILGFLSVMKVKESSTRSF